MLDSQDQVRFEPLVLPHLDAAFNLVRWLLRSPADAEDAAQEAMLRSYSSENALLRVAQAASVPRNVGLGMTDRFTTASKNLVSGRMCPSLFVPYG